MKIAVCVKQVPEGGGQRKIDPQTMRLDRSGEAGLNPFDANAIEEALRIRESGEDAEIVLVSMGPERAAETLRKGLAMGADRAVLVADDALGGIRSRRHERCAREGARARERRTSCCSASRRATPTARCCAAAVAERLQLPLVSQVSELTVAGRQREGEAPDGVRLRPHGGAAPRGDRRLGCDQRAALPVAQGDHGREVEAAGDARARRPRARRGRAPASAGARTSVRRARARRRPAATR